MTYPGVSWFGNRGEEYAERRTTLARRDGVQA